MRGDVVTIGDSRGVEQDSEDRTSIRWWADYAAEDPYAVSGYLLERGLVELEDLTIDTNRYYSPDFARVEEERLWLKVWQAACRENDIPGVGDYVEYEIAGRSVLVVRAADKSIGAFYNSCRHRGTALASECGTASRFVCPFHGWTYGLDGSLESIPAKWDFDYIDQAATGLRRVRAEAFDGWVFVNLDPGAPRLREFLGQTVTRHLEVWPDERMWKAFHYGVVVRANWKIMAEAFYESYHVPRTHPTLIPYSGDLQTQYDSFGLHSRSSVTTMVPALVGGAKFTEQEVLDEALGLLAVAKFSGSAANGESQFRRVELPNGMTARAFLGETVRQTLTHKGLKVEEVSDAELLDGILYQIFPNLMLFRNPGGHTGYRFRPYGTDPNFSLYEVFNLQPPVEGAERPRDVPLHMLSADETFEDYREDMGVRAMALAQDVSNGPLIQKGVRGIERMHYGRTQERNIVAFHRNLDSWLAVH
jgi:phenylpropionate dioxygenase-like ring-hydroxylating dioxygenase large terminal subunit